MALEDLIRSLGLSTDDQKPYTPEEIALLMSASASEPTAPKEMTDSDIDKMVAAVPKEQAPVVKRDPFLMPPSVPTVSKKTATPSMPPMPPADSMGDAAPSITSAPSMPKVAQKPDIMDEYEKLLAQQMQDAGKYTPSKSLVGDPQEILKRLTEAQEQERWGQALSSIAKGLDSVSTATVGKGMLDTNPNAGAGIEQIMSLGKKNLQEELATKQKLDELRQAQEQLELRNRKEGRQEIRDIGTTLLGKKRQEAQEKRDDERLKLDKEKFEEDKKTQDLNRKTIVTNLEKAQLQLKDERAKSNPSSHVSLAAKNFYADQLDNIEMYDMADQIRTGAFSMNQIEDILGKNNLQNLVTQFDATEARREIKEMELAAKKEAAEQKKQQQVAQVEDELRKEVTKADKESQYTAAANQLEAVQKELQNPNGVTDMALIYNVMKSLDPGSVVREGELKLAVNTQSWLAKSLNLPKRITKGDLLAPEQRKKMVDLMAGRVNSARNTFAQMVSPQIERGERAGANMESILPGSYIPHYQTSKKEAQAKTEMGVQAFMQRNGITDRNEAVNILKQHKRIPESYK